MTRAAFIVALTAAAVSGVSLVITRLSAQGIVFALLVVWIPMTWLGSISHVVRIRLPASLHRLRARGS